VGLFIIAWQLAEAQMDQLAMDKAQQLVNMLPKTKQGHVC